MRIVTFNVQHGRPARAASRPGVPWPGAGTEVLAGYCAGLGADLLALQEVDVRLGRSGLVDQAGMVARATGTAHAFGSARKMGVAGQYGNALLVRGTLDDVEVLALPRPMGREPRVAVVATAGVGALHLSVAATHLSVSREEAVVQLETLLEALAGRPGPRVLLGDLNLLPHLVAGPVEAAGMQLADPTEPSYPAHAPRSRIDHVAVSGLSIASVDVLGAAPVSDHRALAVEARPGSS